MAQRQVKHTMSDKFKSFKLRLVFLSQFPNSLSKRNLIECRNWLARNLINQSRIKAIESPNSSGPSIPCNSAILYTCRIKPKLRSIFQPYIGMLVHAINDIRINWLWWNSWWQRWINPRPILSHVRASPPYAI